MYKQFMHCITNNLCTVYVQTIYALYNMYKQFMHCIICTNNLCTVYVQTIYAL